MNRTLPSSLTDQEPEKDLSSPAESPTSAPHPASSLPGEAGPLTITVPLDQIQVEEEISEDYWLGTMPNCPLQNIVLGGVSFPSFTGVLRYAPKTLDPIYPETRGAVVKLSSRELKVILDRVPLYFVRRRGSQVSIVSKTSRQFRPAAGDVPVAAYLYLVRLSDAMPIDWRRRTPEPMYRLPPKEE